MRKRAGEHIDIDMEIYVYIYIYVCFYLYPYVYIYTDRHIAEIGRHLYDIRILFSRE